MLERRHVLGGAAVTEEVFPGFHFSECSYVVSLLRPDIIRHLDLARHGLEILPLDGTFTPMHGDYLWRVNDHATTYRQIARHSRTDAEAYDEYGRAMVEMARFVKPIIEMTPADPLSMHPRDVGALAQMGRRFLQLAPGDRYNLAQLMTMSAVDFLDGWFETDVLKATMAASGIIGTFLGVRSPGTAYVLLHHYMGEIDGAFRSWGFARGGTGAISLAIAAAAREAGVEIRTQRAGREDPRRERPRRRRRAAERRRAARERRVGQHGSAARRSSGSSAKRTCRTDFVEHLRRFRYRGSSGKVNLALDALPDFTLPARAAARTCAEPCRSRRASITWSARTTMRSTGGTRSARTSTW